MHRNAFTMIELIFVIVILGILATVAIPKLAATRDDAKIATKVHSIVTGIEEIVAYTVSQGELNTSIANMSNSFDQMEKHGEAVILSVPTQKAVIKVGSVVDCLSVDINSTGQSDTLEIVFGNPNADIQCLEVQKRFSTTNYTITLKGETLAQ